MTSFSTEQKAIIQHPVDKHAVVLAVAGSGKSTTMAERIAYLVEAKRVDPAHIVAVMFNKAASLELAEKLEKRLGKRNAPLSATYHRLGTLTLNRLMREKLVPEWTFEASPTKAQYFAMDVLADVCRRLDYKYPRFIADAFLGFVDRVKSDMVSPEKAWEDGDWQEGFDWFVPWYGKYEDARAKAGKRFFSDLIYDPVVAMQNNPKAASVIADRYAHVIVDEYQDICESQQALVRFVAGKKARVMVVGDDDQTIYTWRGAKPSYILRDFVKDFPGAATYQLTRTWRYGHALSCAANYVITGNDDRADKLCVSGDKAPDTRLHMKFDLYEEGQPNVVVDVVNSQLEAGLKLQDIAVLVRSYARSGSTQFAFLHNGIPFRLEGGESVAVLENRWVASLLGWMALAAGEIAPRPYVGEPDLGSIFALRKIIDVPETKVSFEASKKLAALVLQYPDNGVGFNKFASTELAVTDGSLAGRVTKRGRLWSRLRENASKSDKINPYMLLDQLIAALEIESAIYDKCANEEDAEDQWSLVKSFLVYVKTCSGSMNLKQFLRHVDDLRSFSERAKASTDAIHMTSVHRSKGLEWPTVIMIGLTQGGFPIKPKRTLDEDEMERHLEDERRLFYVAMTRARLNLYFIAPEDNDLMPWLNAGRSGCPEDMPFDHSSASQFLYESNLVLSRIMPRYIRDDSLKVFGADVGVFNEYLNLIGVPQQARSITRLNETG